MADSSGVWVYYGGIDMKCPSHLSKAAVKWWNELCEQYDFTPDSFMLLVTLLETFDEYQQARKLILKNGSLIRGKNGIVKKNPAVELLKVSRSHFLATWRLLGFNVQSPADMR
jgi:P27 family predicted phage terminase small subunit